eukprot:1445448-Amphidinium_carterae.1
MLRYPLSAGAPSPDARLAARKYTNKLGIASLALGEAIYHVKELFGWPSAISNIDQLALAAQ